MFGVCGVCGSGEYILKIKVTMGNMNSKILFALGGKATSKWRSMVIWGTLNLVCTSAKWSTGYIADARSSWNKVGSTK